MNTLLNNYKGLSNLGNTCYLNAGLQLIINNKELCNNMLLTQPTSFLSQFIMEYYNNTSNITLNPSFIKELMGNKNNEFIGFKQNDSFELIIYLLEYIFENYKMPNLYQITTDIKIKCKLLTCLNINKHQEHCNYLILDTLDNFKDLDDCYRNYKQREKLLGDNSYYCEKCKDKRIASKRTEITNWPKHLIIILKRFTNNGRLQKNNNKINVPLIWRHGYHLKGIVSHSGSLTGGHYIYIGNHNNKWIMFNDDHCSEIPVNFLDNYKNTGYIYYFEKT